MKEEIWKPVKDYEGLYEVSNYGKVRSIERVSCGRNFRKQEIKLQFNHAGYHRINLYNGTKAKGVLVHRLVAQSFIPNPDNKKVVNHIDGKKTNNHVSNLEWVTHAENNKHAHEIGLRSGVANLEVRIKASVEKCSVPVVRINKETGERKVYKSAAEAGRDVGGTNSNIIQVCKGNNKSTAGYYWEYLNKERA